MSDNAYVSQVVTEVLYQSASNARVSQSVVEVLYAGNSNARVSQVVVEVLRSADTVTEFDVSVTSTANVSHHIALNSSVISVSITSTGSASHLVFVNSPRVVSINSQCYVAHTVDGASSTIYVSITSAATVSQGVSGRQGIYRVSILSTANADSRFVRRDITIEVNVVSTANIRQRVNSEYRLDVVSTANIDQNYTTRRFIVTQILNDTGTLLDEFVPTRETVHLIHDQLSVINTYVRGGTTYFRDIQDINTLKDQYKSVIVVSDSGYVYDPYPVGPGQPPIISPPHPVVTGTPVVSSQQTIIESRGGTVILPAAEYGDTFAPKIQNNVKRTMTGKLYTYIRTQETTKFTLTWILGLQKALELVSVIKNNNDNYLQSYYILTLWNGQIWKAKIITVEIPITHEGRWQNSDNNNSEIEKMTASVQFEGIQLL